jgi:choline dehydrogenase-like flavoprotein
MVAKFDLNDDSVVVIIGTGAGGGVLANELAQKGVKVVALEAGGRYLPEDYVNDEWESFTQLAWLDARTTSGTWRVAKDFSGLPAWIVKAVGGTTTHWAGASIRFQDHEWKALSTYGAVEGASLLDWPIDAAEMAPWYEKAETKLGVTRTGDRQGLPGNNNYKVFEKGAKALGYKDVHTGRMAINSTDYDGRMACQQTGFCFQGCKWGAKWSAAYTDIPAGEATGNLEVRERSHAARILHNEAGKVTGVEYFDADGNLQFQGPHRLRRRQHLSKARASLLNSASSMFPNGLANSSDQVGRNYMRHTTGSVYAIFDKPVRMWRGTTMAGIIQDEARHDPSAGSSAGMSWKPLRWVCPSWRPSSTPAAGGAASPPRLTITRTWRACGSWARTCRRRPTASRCRKPRTSTACRSPTSTSTTIRTTWRCATTPTSRAWRCTKPWGPPRLPDAALSLDAQPRHQPDVGAARGWRGEQVGPDP